MQKTVAKINLKAVQNNAKIFKQLTGVKLCAVVKANAYGHGGVETSNALSGVADFFAVALIEEGLEIRQATCGKEILILTPPTDENEVCLLFDERFILTVDSLRTAKLAERTARRANRSVKVHLKVNTGMNRYGAGLSETGKICKFLKDSPYVKVTGAYSHLYSTDAQTSYQQREIFLRAKTIIKRYYENVLFHLSATFGCLLGEPFYFDAVRVGLGLYGYLPSGSEWLKNDLPLKKAMRVYAKITSSKSYYYGGLGYGKNRSSEEKKGRKIRTIRVGYADGFLRAKDNGLVGEKENTSCLCMDACLRYGKKRRGGYELIFFDADETAKATGTLSYEVLCKATSRAQFEYLYE